MTTTLAQPLNEIATRWQIDPAHTNVEFAVRHLMISTVKGRFADVAGTITLDPTDPAAASVDVDAQDREHRYASGPARRPPPLT